MTTKKGGSGGGGEKPPKLKRKMITEKTMLVPVAITEAEFVKRAAELAQIDPDLGALENRKKAVMKELEARKAELISTRSRLSQVVKSRTEPREVTVQGWANFKDGVYEEIRLDTGKVIEGSTRPLNPEERQENLALDEDDEPAAHLTPDQKKKVEEKKLRAVKDPVEAAKEAEINPPTNSGKAGDTEDDK
jgi:hypothetical protein